MKYPSICLAVALACALPVSAADFSAKITDVHLCCQSCVKAAEKAVTSVTGATAAVDKDAGTVTITAKDKRTAQNAANALIKAGFWGKSDTHAGSSLLLREATGASGKQVKTLKVAGVHLCCGKCVNGVNDALKDVTGVKANTATKGAESFEVTGDFKDSDVFAALRRAGYTGHVGK